MTTAAEINLSTKPPSSDQLRSKSCCVKDSCDFQTVGSHISNWFFVEELTRTVGAETADRWVRHQTVNASRLKRCRSNPAKPSPLSSLTVSPTLSSTSFRSHLGGNQSMREMTTIKDEAADMSFPQQPKTSILSDLPCFRDTSSFLPSQSRQPRSSCGAAASISALCDRRVLPDREARLGLLFTDAAHTVLD
uniref:Uncharacterized protein n=1 Tax=Cryptomonas curvata TaxID=233186 RepID=A0A7S0QN74_9CRYP|mmetsp:Transcript_38050/g.79722  ORF Transcript_38050/g.79722 Transcript_38050/m.79722 type:complete len:192 (-) Transcript_38050:128-703(-)